MNEVQSVAQAPQKAKLRILLADDSRIIRVAVRRILAGDEVDLVEASDGEEAWQQLLEDDRIDVLLTDLGMPKLDGYGLIERIRDPQNPRRLRNLPVVVLSGADEPEEKQRALEAGASDYVTKPFDTQQITDRVHALAREAARHRDDVSAAGDHDDPGALDPETGLANRALFEQQGEKDIAFARRYAKDMCLLVLSIDHIDELIESHGTSLVDQLVRRLGQFVVQCLRRPDSVGRLGRHQFGVLAPMTNDLGGMTIANRILQRVRAVRFNTPRGPLSFTVSIGLAAPRSATLSDYVALHEIAARRQQAAQAAGGDRVVFAERDSSVLEAVAESNIAAENAAQAEAETALPQIDAPAASESAAQPRVPVEEEDALPALDMTADDGDDADATQSVAHMLDELPPSLDVITWMIDSGQGERLAVHRRALLCRLLPLLDFAAGDHELHLDTPLAVIRSRLK